MKSRTERKTTSNEPAAHVVTFGEVFEDGIILDLVSASSSKLNLVRWDGHKATISPRVEHGGRAYEAPELPRALCGALRFPSACAPYGSARELYNRMRDSFQQHSGLPDRACGLLSAFSFHSWQADRQRMALVLAITGLEPELGVQLLRQLSGCCRFPLLVAEVTPGFFRSFSFPLTPTLLIDQQELRPNMQRLFRASGNRDFFLPGVGGRLTNVSGPKAVLCGVDVDVEGLGDGILHISVGPAQFRSSLDECAQNEIANDFQPQLLSYRLTNLNKIDGTQFDASEFTPALQPLARTLAACFPEDPTLAREVVELLKPQDIVVRKRAFFDVKCAVLEVLWGKIHGAAKQRALVQDLAKDVNALLWSRGETLFYTAETVGWRLRDLGIPRHSSTAGRQVQFGRDTSARVHRLSYKLGLPFSEEAVSGCPDCQRSDTT